MCFDNLFVEQKVAILVVGYLGIPETAGFIACDVAERYSYTKYGIQKICSMSKAPVYIAITGDYDQYLRLVSECLHLKCEFSYFEQDFNKLKLGSGALEVDAIKNAIYKFDLKKYKRVIKITAKYYVKNLSAVEKFIASDSSLIRAWLGAGHRMCDTRLFAFEPDFFLSNYGRLGNVSKNEWLERKVFEALEFRKKSYYFYKRPLMVGYSGTTGVRDELKLYKVVLVCLFTFFRIKL